MDGFFPRLGAGVAKLHWLVISLWVAVIIIAVTVLKVVPNALTGGGFEVAESESGQGAAILEQEFGRRTVTTGVMVFSSDRATIDEPQYSDAVLKAIDRVKSVEGVGDILSFTSGNPRLVSADRKTTYAVVNFLGSEDDAKKVTPKVRDQLAEEPPGVRAYLMGFPALSYDMTKSSTEDLHKAEVSTMPLTLILLLVVFGTILAAGLPVILGATVVMISLAGIYLFAQHVETSVFATQTAAMIGLGIGIDFSLLMVSRFREELERGFSPHQATINTVATSGRSIVFSGLTVMLGLSVLCLYKLALIRSIALAMLLAAGVAMLAAVTLLPALMALFGHKLNAFRLIPGSGKKRSGHEGEGKWHRWSLLVMRQPWLFLIITVGVLLALSKPAFEINAIGSGGSRGMPRDTETRQSFEVMQSSFGPGEAFPISIIVKTPNANGAWDPKTLQAVYQLVRKIEADPRVQRVDSMVSLVNALIPNITEQQFMAIDQQQLLPHQQIARFIPTFINIRRPTDTADRRADTHTIAVISKEDELNQDTLDLVHELRNEIVPWVAALKDIRAETFTTGQTSIILDYRDTLRSEFPKLVGLVLLVTYVVLLLFFHSLILPLKAILMNVISILASYGVLVLVFQHGFAENLLDFEHLGRLSMFAPVILFSILFGLSTDYEVFLLSRVKELYHQTHDNERSVAMGLERTAGIITAAGLIMIVVFGAFALGDTLVIKELGVGLAVAVLLDSTIIRVMMVPASMKLMGDLNWWMPKWLDWIPQIRESDEGPAMAPVAAVHAPAAVAFAAPSEHRACPTCRAPLRSTARFCGRCGTQLAAPPVPARVAIPAGAGHTVADWRIPPATAAFPTPDVVQGGPGGVRRVPVMLSNGRQHQRAWLVLRDCEVEGLARGSVPQLQIAGLDVASLAGSEPEIQIRNARVRL